jgi:hypothetical protein
MGVVEPPLWPVGMVQPHLRLKRKMNKKIVKVLALRGHESGSTTPFFNIYIYILLTIP